MKTNSGYKYDPDNPITYEVIDRIIKRTTIYTKMSDIKKYMQDYNFTFLAAANVCVLHTDEYLKYVKVFERYSADYITRYNRNVRYAHGFI